LFALEIKEIMRGNLDELVTSFLLEKDLTAPKTFEKHESAKNKDEKVR